MEALFLFLKKHWKGTVVTLAIALSVMFTPIIILIAAPQIITAANAAVCSTSAGTLPDRVPPRLNAVFTQAASQYGVPAYALPVVYHDEWYGETHTDNDPGDYREPPPPYGKGKPYNSSGVGASGPFQFMPGTWRLYRNSNPAHRPGDIQDLVDSAYAAAHLLANLGAKGNASFGDPSNPQRGTVIWAIAAYNAGPGGDFSNAETSQYIKRAAEEYTTYFAGKAPKPLSSEMVKLCDQQDDPGTVDDPPSFAAGCPADSPGSIVRMGNGTRIKVCRIHGMIVNAKIASKWQYLVQKAKADGINLTGGGFRTASQQISLRRAHCGPSHYDVYVKSAKYCSPPTARPGTSYHEKALAVDLNNARSYSSRVYRWMRVHAPPLGIQALVPGEPWHWSLGGH